MKQIDTAAYAGTTLIGKVGVEAAYEQQLHGKPGFKEILVNAAGRPVEKQGEYAPQLSSHPPVAGKDLILGLDVRVQEVAEAALAGKRGSVVALDPRTGDIIALASTPGFDPNGFVRGLSVAEYSALQNNIDKPLLNRALRGATHRDPPSNPVRACGTEIRRIHPIAGRVLSRVYAAGAAINTATTRSTAFSICARLSASPATYTLSGLTDCIEKMDPRRPSGTAADGNRYSRREGDYMLPEWKRHAFKRAATSWFPGSPSAWASVRSITVTPLQQAHFAAEIAERGKFITTPRLVSAIRAAGSATATARSPISMKPVDIGTDEQWAVVQDGMIAAVYGAGGTAYAVGVGSKYKIAGKTGTAQVFTIKQTENTRAKIVDERRRDHAWFIAYAPADDPKIAISVLVENGGFGATAAAPIARKVLDAFLLEGDVSESKRLVIN
jgi:penicillin-binding protein 2